MVTISVLGGATVFTLTHNGCGAGSRIALMDCIVPATGGGSTTINQPANITVCNGANVPASNFTSTPAGATFTWTNSNTAIGLDRTFLAILSSSYKEEQLEDGSERTVLKLPAFLAPYKAAVLPLVKKDGLPEKAREIMDLLKYDYNCQYDEKDSVGKRYRRQDANGTPFCITVDHQTLEDYTVTIRHRDTMEQNRVAISELKDIINQEVNVKTWLQKM